MAGSATYTQFIDAIQALTVSGVVRKYEEPPRPINTADMPCSFVWFPEGDNKPLTFEGGRQFGKRQADFIVLYADTAPDADQPFTETVAMMDAVETALKTLEVGFSKPTWTIVSRLFDETAERRFWAVIASISGTG